MARCGRESVPAAGSWELKECSETCFIAGAMYSLVFVFTDPFPGISTLSMECFFLNKVVCALQKCREGACASTFFEVSEIICVRCQQYLSESSRDGSCGTGMFEVFSLYLLINFYINLIHNKSIPITVVNFYIKLIQQIHTIAVKPCLP